MSEKHAHYTAVEHEAADAWHHHDLAAEGAPQSEHAAIARPAVLFQAFIAITLVVVVLVGILWVYFQNYTTALKASVIETTVLSKDYNQMKAKMDNELAGFSLGDAAGDKVNIPIDLAKQRVLKRYQQMEPGVKGGPAGDGH